MHYFSKTCLYSQLFNKCLQSSIKSRSTISVQQLLWAQCSSVHTSSTCQGQGVKSKWIMPYFKEMKVRHDDMVKKGLVPVDRRSTYLEWNFPAELRAFQVRLSESFEQDVLMLALLDNSHLEHQNQQQRELGLTSIDKAHGVGQQAEESNKQLSADGRQLIQQHCTAFVTEAWPGLPLEGVQSVVDYLNSDEVINKVAQSIGIKDLIFAEPYPPSPEVMARAGRAVVAALHQSAGHSRTASFVTDFVCTHLTGKTIWDMWQLPDPVGVLEELVSRSGLTVEPRLVHKAGSNTIEATYQVAFFDSNKTFIAAGNGESIDIAKEEAARNSLSKYFGDTSSRPALPFMPSLPPAQSNVAHRSGRTQNGNKPLADWTLENSDPRAHNIVHC